MEQLTGIIHRLGYSLIEKHPGLAYHLVPHTKPESMLNVLLADTTSRLDRFLEDRGVIDYNLTRIADMQSVYDGPFKKYFQARVESINERLNTAWGYGPGF